MNMAVAPAAGWWPRYQHTFGAPRSRPAVWDVNVGRHTLAAFGFSVFHVLIPFWEANERLSQTYPLDRH